MFTDALLVINYNSFNKVLSTKICLNIVPFMWLSLHKIWGTYDIPNFFQILKHILV